MMKNTSIILLLIGFAGFFSSCGEKKSESSTTSTALHEVTVPEGAMTFVVDESRTTISWLGKKLTGQHNGTIPVKNGMVYWENGKIAAAAIELDMNGIKVLDIQDPADNKDLTDHLKDEDFFSAAQYPTGTLKVFGMEGKKVRAELMLKGINQPIEFDADVTQAGDSLIARAKFSIDRTRWDIKYKSGKFFPELGDKVISDDIGIEVSLAAYSKTH